MTLQPGGRLAGRRFSVDEEEYVCLECYARTDDVQSFMRHRCGVDKAPEQVDRPADDPEVMPPDYTKTGGGGGFYEVFRPDGTRVDGPSNGKWHGADGAAGAAWDDYEG